MTYASDIWLTIIWPKWRIFYWQTFDRWMFDLQMFDRRILNWWIFDRQIFDQWTLDQWIFDLWTVGHWTVRYLTATKNRQNLWPNDKYYKINQNMISGQKYAYNDIECTNRLCFVCSMTSKRMYQLRGHLPNNEFGRRYVVHFSDNPLEIKNVKGSQNILWSNSTWKLKETRLSQSYTMTHTLPPLGNQVWIQTQNGKQHQLKLTQVRKYC